MRNMKKKFVVIAAMAAMLLLLVPSMAFAADNGTSINPMFRPLTEEELAAQKALEPEIVAGARQLPGDTVISGEEASSGEISNDGGTLPSVYDPRKESWFPGIIKHQGASDMCWAFATTTVGEISYAKQYGVKKEFSPAQLAYFVYNRVTDPVGYTVGDKTQLVKDSDNPVGSVNYAKAGGNANFAAQSLATWSGYADESVAPFSTYVDSNGIGTSLDSSLAYKDSAVIKDVAKPETHAQIKKLVMNNGGVVASIYYRDSGMHNYNFYYSGPEDSTNHAISIVGWDDDYLGSGEPVWIAQNSWGKDWGDGGYFYISQDEYIASMVSISVQKPSVYANNYQYDGSAALSTISYDPGESTGNIFTVKGSGTNDYKKIDAVGIGAGAGTFDIDVYTDVTGSNPRSGKLVCGVDDVKFGTNGFHTVVLPKSVYAKKGSKFSVVVSAKTSAAIAVDASINYNWVKTVSATKPGQSYIYYSGSWKDLNDNSYASRIKAYVNEAADISIPYTSYKYTGSAITPAVTVKDPSGKTLVKGTDYSVTYTNNKLPGTGYATVTVTGKYAGTAKIPFTITCKTSNFRQTAASTSAVKLGWNQVKCTGYIIYKYTTSGYKAVKTISNPATISYTDSSLKSGRLYKYKIRPYVKSGSTTIKGSLSAEIAAATKPGKVTQKSLSTGSTHYIKASWNVQTGSGYQVVVAKNSGFKNAKSYLITSSSTKVKKITGCTKGSRYYVKVRAYRTCNGKRVYGAYSIVKNIVCK